MNLKPRPTLTFQHEEWIDRTFSSLSLREKIGQTAQERFGGFADGKPDIIQRYFEKALDRALFGEAPFSDHLPVHAGGEWVR
jgi:hypothetical protein